MTLLAANFEDPERARIIYLAAGGLVLIAVLVVIGTVWWWRSAAVEHPALAPLEVMGTKSWSQGDDDDRRSRLDSVRPSGAQQGSDSTLVVPDPVDLLEPDRTRPLDFDDLADPGDSADEEFDDVGDSIDLGWRHPDVRQPDIRRDGVRRPSATAPTRPRAPIDPLLRRPGDR